MGIVKEPSPDEVGGPNMVYPSASSAAHHFSTSGISVAVATAVTHPLDVLKVRLQMQLVGQKGQLLGMGRVLTQVMKNEGARALYLGIMPALTRSLLYGGVRLGLYEPCKYVCDFTFGSTNVLVKIACGAFSGVIATALTNPMEVLKVRLQMNSSRKLQQGRRGAIREIHSIVAREGVKALWKGVGPAMARAGALTASQLATYDESKQALLRLTVLEEGFQLHFISSVVAGTMGTLATTPLDMIKTRLMLQRESNASRIYNNGFHCAYKVLNEEGFRAVYKGGLVTFMRLGPQTTITFVVCEKLREISGKKSI
ncbi:hypothetical protein ZOSMA_5G01020 [Zostera marina]|uniref:Mitochondrial substrate carrier family protein ucpB n=1 Tax=Zostera marina TaxID=29655 RepID=A0A0K9NW15_ZOSMR|nr:hypothetical protein ZOSMA_5G01020 [Zostera marina]